jgi:hypothetical protein
MFFPILSALAALALLAMPGVIWMIFSHYLYLSFIREDAAGFGLSVPTKAGCTLGVRVSLVAAITATLVAYRLTEAAFLLTLIFLVAAIIVAFYRTAQWSIRQGVL